MRKVALVNTYGQKYFPLPVNEALKSTNKYWPEYIQNYVYPDDISQQIELPRTHYYELVKEQPTLQTFIDRHKDNPELNPRILETKEEQQDHTKDSGRNIFEKDAVRFSFKVFACIDAYQKSKDTCQQLWYLDADILTFETIPQEWLEHIMPEDCFTSYLGRPKKGFSETGIYIFNIAHPYAEEFFTRWQRMYDEDEFFKLKGYTDSYTFDGVRIQMENEGKIKNNDLNDGRYAGHRKAKHPFINSELGEYMDHLKGYTRKDKMSSHKRDLTVKHKHPYWKTIS